jgi:hypothetical protein
VAGGVTESKNLYDFAVSHRRAHGTNGVSLWKKFRINTWEGDYPKSNLTKTDVSVMNMCKLLEINERTHFFWNIKVKFAGITSSCININKWFFTDQVTEKITAIGVQLFTQHPVDKENRWNFSIA